MEYVHGQTGPLRRLGLRAGVSLQITGETALSPLKI